MAFVAKEAAGDARLETQRVRLLGKAEQGRSTPRLSSADVVLPAAQAIAGTGTTRITYYAPYRPGGFTGSNPGRVWAATVTGEITGDPAYDDDLVGDGPAAANDEQDPLPRIGFGGAAGDVGSDHAGGFVQPSLTIAGLSLSQGPVGELATVATGTFDPKAFLGDALPKLFGIVELSDLLPSGTLDAAPSLITDALDTLSAIEKEVQRAVGIAADAVTQAQRALDKVQGAGGDAQAAAQQLLDDAQALAQSYVDLAGALPTVVGALAGLDVPAVVAALSAEPDGLQPLLARAAAATRLLARPPLPLFSRTRLEQVAGALERFAASGQLANDVVGLLKGLELAKKEVTFRYEWTPTMASWPPGGPPLLTLKPDSLVLAVHGTLRASGPPSVEVLAELRSFQLNLFASEPLITIPFDRLSFKSGSSGKAEVDVVMDDIVFGGFLSFIETVKDLIPLDGFSDPPSVEVTPAGLTAGFSLTLPNLAIGVFSLSNMSLGADVRVPFLGETISVGFNFCSRERPFVLAVVFLGGGGWFLVRLSPNGLEVLELGLEAGAYLAVDFGVASGSISAPIGIYIRLEGKKGSLTGYFRLRGEVDVLGLISASIELYMELVFNFDTGKMVGRGADHRRGRGALLLRQRHDRGRAAVRRVQRRPDPARGRHGGRRLGARLGRLPARLRARGGGGMNAEWFTAIALPVSVAEDAAVHVNVFIAPTLRPDHDDAELGEFELFRDWGDVVAGGVEVTLVDQLGEFPAAVDTSGLDQPLWRKAFGPRTPVRDNRVPEWQQRDWRTFAAKDCSDIAKAVHLATIAADPVTPVAPLAHPLTQAVLEVARQAGALTFAEGHDRRHPVPTYDESALTRYLDDGLARGRDGAWTTPEARPGRRRSGPTRRRRCSTPFASCTSPVGSTSGPRASSSTRWSSSPPTRSRRCTLPGRSSTSGSPRPATTPPSCSASAWCSRCAPTPHGCAAAVGSRPSCAPASPTARAARRGWPCTPCATTPSSPHRTPTTPPSGPTEPWPWATPRCSTSSTSTPTAPRSRPSASSPPSPGSPSPSFKKMPADAASPAMRASGLTVTRRQQAGRALTQLDRQEGYQGALA